MERKTGHVHTLVWFVLLWLHLSTFETSACILRVNEGEW